LKGKILILGLLLLLGGCGATGEKQQEKTVMGTSEEKQRAEVNKDVKTAEEISSEEETKEESTKLTASQDAAQTSPQYRMTEDFSIHNIMVPEEKVVLLTIDDAPDENALAMAKTLKDLNVKAIFFVNGHFIDTPEEGEVLKQIHEMGFPIGNHTYNHKSLKDLTEEEQRQEIVGLNDRIEELIGERPQFFRAPFGMNTDFSKKLAADEQMLLMNWTYGYDWVKEYQSKEALANIMINTPYLRNGANLLMHDREWTSAALADIVKGLQNKGYKIADPLLIETPKNKTTAAQ
jgi:peptidoglycan/xylan/chitin deacetylase (PgdA/CDA1 family)